MLSVKNTPDFGILLKKNVLLKKIIKIQLFKK